MEDIAYDHMSYDNFNDAFDCLSNQPNCKFYCR